MHNQQQQEDDKEMNKHQQHQDRKLKTIQTDEQAQAQAQAQVQAPAQRNRPHRCPRCESLNTKFCYYNNYSLSQPRYYCKTCKRYWTQGGTLRNVPVGGGSRKGKRSKTSSASSSSSTGVYRSQPQEAVQTQPNLTAVIRAKDPSSAVGSPPVVAPPIGPYYQGGGGGFLASLAAIQSLNPSQPFNQSLNVGADVMGTNSNLGLLSGFNVASLGSQQHPQQHQICAQPQFYQVGNRDMEVASMYPAAQQGLIQSTMANTNCSSASHHDWPQSFINNANHRASDASLWSTISTASISANSESNASGGSSSLVPNQWPDLPGYGAPPP